MNPKFNLPVLKTDCGSSMSPFAFQMAFFFLLLMVLVGKVNADSKQSALTESDSRAISSARLFDEPLVPLGVPTQRENQALAIAINGMMAHSSSHETQPLENFISSYPNSPWNASLLCNLGTMYYRTGYYSKALNVWEEAWRLSKSRTDVLGKAIGDRSVGELAIMNAKLGRLERLEPLLKEVQNRNVRGAATEKIQGAKEGLWLMKNKPQDAFKCGPYALARLLFKKKSDIKLQDKIYASKSTTKGVSLLNVYKLSKQVGLSLQLAKRDVNAPVLFPAVVNWKVGHYAAIIALEHGAYHIQDPTFGDDRWISQQTLDMEASGYFLVPTQKLPKGWRAVDEKEAGNVWGKGSTSSSDPNSTTPSDNTTGGDGCPGGSIAMPTYRFHTMLASLNIIDIPLAYDPPRGPGVNFRITYNQREAKQPDIFNYSNLGNKWTLDWLSYVTDDPDYLTADANLFVQGGGTEVYSDFDTVTSSYAPQIQSQAVLVRVSSSPIRYERRLPNGAEEIFDVPNGEISFPRKIFLSQIIDPKGQTLSFSYDGALRITTVTDALGQVTTISYGLGSDSLKITEVTDPFGRTAALTYTNDGQLESITDMAGLSSSFTYGDGDFINSMITPYGTTHFLGGSISDGRWLEGRDPLGQRERLEYRHHDAFINDGAPFPDSMLVSTSMVGHEPYSIFWDKKAMMEGVGDIKNAVVYQWIRSTSLSVASNIFASIKKPLERRTYYNYQNQDTYLQITDGVLNRPTKIGRVLDDSATQLIQYEYNSIGKITKYTDPSKRITAYAYDSNNIDLVSIRQQTGGVNELLDTITYDSLHSPLTVTDASGQLTSLTYNGSGQVLTSTNPRGEITTYSYDSLGYLIRITRAVSGDTTKFAYDVFGRVRTVTQNDGYALTTDYDSLNRPIKVHYPDSTYEEIVYNRLDVERNRDRLGRWTTTLHNALRQPTVIQDALGRTTNLEWCSCGHLASQTDPMGKSTTWKRDVQGRVKEKVYADGKKVQYEYEPASGRLKRLTDALDQKTDYQYNVDDNLAQTSYMDAIVSTPTVSFTYDSTYNRLLGMADGQGTTSYRYYPVSGSPSLGAGQLKSVDGPWANDSLIFTYDSLGRVASRSINGVSVSYTYDNLGRVKSSTNALGTFAYKFVGATSRMDSLIYPNGQKTKYSYFTSTGDFLLQEIKNLLPSLAQLSKSGYTYDAESQIQTWTQQSDSAVASTQTFTHDPVNQLLGDVVRSASGGNPILTHFAYSYDKSGNRLSSLQDSTVNSFSYNDLNQISSQQAGGNTRFKGTVSEAATITINGQSVPVSSSHEFDGFLGQSSGTDTATIEARDYSNNSITNRYRLTISGTSKSFTYDDVGNLTDDGMRTYEWDAENRLTAIVNGGLRSEFFYDGLNRRVEIIEKSSGTVISKKKYLWTGNLIAEERDSTGGTILQRYFGYGVKIGTSKYFYTKDHLGSILEMTDSLGSVVARYAYDPYGVKTKVSGAQDADFGFAGYFVHSVSGLSFAKYRVYNALLGGWSSRDPIEELGGMNLYGYVHGNPINFMDPLGLYDWFGKAEDNAGEFSQDSKDIGLSGAASAGFDAAIASKSAKRMGYEGESDGPQDAMRHCIWSCLMTQDMGEDNAATAGENHENAGDAKGQTCKERKMDEHNNKEGRKAGKSAGARSCQQMCMDSYAGGGLEVIQ
ncbi:MAG: hypothetical protein JWO30_886 [Fibrobacteres bacterium]|nr:hypothetical protein [Fibrobacterota bacterium]